MKVKELIEALQKMPQDLEVFGMADHGQVPEKVYAPSVAYTDNLGHIIWGGYCTNAVEAEECCMDQQFVLL